MESDREVKIFAHAYLDSKLLDMLMVDNAIQRQVFQSSQIGKVDAT